MSTERLTDTAAGTARAAELLRIGALVAFPTETVYGLGADARHGESVARIFAAKARPSFNPLIVHVADLETAQRFGSFSPQALQLAERFWPGPLSLVVPCKPDSGVSELVTAGLETVALRVPAHSLAQQLLRAFDGPVAAPSANPSGRISPTTAAHVLAGLDGRIAAVLDGGPCTVGLESTIIAPGPPARLLRPGGLDLTSFDLDLAGAEPGQITSPGQMASHYAPKAALRLGVIHKEPTEVHLGFGSVTGDLSLSASGDLIEAATRLFACLHALDADGRPIAVAPIPETGLGTAINDRLRRAAAPR